MKINMSFLFKVTLSVTLWSSATFALIAFAQAQPVPPVSLSKHWQLVWQDEFDGKQLDKSKWSFEINCYGGGNNEQQCYTDRRKNAYIEQGILKIVALKEEFTGPAAQDDTPSYSPENTRTLPYTSARLRTKNKGDWRYGRFEIRAKLPQGQGTWPAIWMLPTDWRYGGWAGSGEIDIMEAVNLNTITDEKGQSPNQAETRIHGTLHYGRAWPDNVYSGQAYRLPNGADPANDFHVYAIEWQQGEIRWYVDDIHYATQRASGWYSQYMNAQGVLVNGLGSAPFDQKFHLILNLAVGGAWATTVNDKGIDPSIFPQSLAIDYIRVYQCQKSINTGIGCGAIVRDTKLVKGHVAPVLPR
ncbi:beta-glucanase [Thalassotalea insulae]|uniref:Beta-glucanase n=1 Tax=Thalassotalea insulae TaxID=2056778 RepID=A0ABQ6GPB5_9GAMM|nr:beta-glucanase [Thalassotalea insulae]